MQNNLANIIVDLEDLIINNIKTDEENILIYSELERKKQVCPRCKNLTREVHDIREQKIKDVCSFNKKVYIILKKHRYVCNKCNKRFLEENEFLVKHQRMTKRLVKQILDKLTEERSFTSVSKEINVSTTTIIRIFDKIEYSKEDLKNVDVISIDEFKGNTGGEKYNCVIADAKSRVVLDVLCTRKLADLQDYFLKLDRKNVKYFVSDMWQPYKDLAKNFFKNAKFIADKYHYIRQVIWAFEKVRKEEQKKFARARRIHFKKSKSLLLKRFHNLNEEDKQAVNVMLYASENILKAYSLKELYFDMLYEDDIKEKKKLLKEFILHSQNSNLDAFVNCARTYQNWGEGILNSFEEKYTNGFIEGCNNKIKTLKRIGYGYRNFKRFRNRILHIFNYQRERLKKVC